MIKSYCLLFSTLIYGKLLALWAAVLLADHFLDFRFEYLWPFWLFLRSIYDSLKYQGMVRAQRNFVMKWWIFTHVYYRPSQYFLCVFL